MFTVALYDSGVGGLSILKSIEDKVIQTYPSLSPINYIYVTDNLHYPYGTKTEEQIIEYVTTTVYKLISSYKIDILVIACNTASTLVLPHLRKNLSIPIIGVVPAIKPASLLSNTKTIGIIATKATITRNYLEELIDKYGKDCSIIKVGSSILVDQAELKLRNTPISISLIEKELTPFLNNKDLDYLVLGCTHFTHLKKEIESIFEKHNRSISVIDSSLAVAKHSIDVMFEKIFKSPSPFNYYKYNYSSYKNIFIFTKKDPNSEELINTYLKNTSYTVRYLD